MSFGQGEPWVRTGSALVGRRAFRIMKHLELDPAVEMHRRANRVEFWLWGNDVPPPDVEQSLYDCPAALVRGAFLVRGYLSEIDRPLHWEIQAATDDVAAILIEAIRALGVEPHLALRRHWPLIYLKERDAIVALLGHLGAYQSVLALESQSVVRAMKNQVNRLVNSETANMKRIVDAALKDSQAVLGLMATEEWSALRPELRRLAELRVEHPDWSFEELGRHLTPPLSKSAVNHRLRQIRARWRQYQKPEP